MDNSFRQECRDRIRMEAYLWLSGWMTNDHSGRWHPPACLANWPIDQAFAMAKETGPMTRADLREYHRSCGMRMDGWEECFDTMSRAMEAQP